MTAKEFFNEITIFLIMVFLALALKFSGESDVAHKTKTAFLVQSTIVYLFGFCMTVIKDYEGDVAEGIYYAMEGDK